MGPILWVPSHPMGWDDGGGGGGGACWVLEIRNSGALVNINIPLLQVKTGKNLVAI